MLGDNPTLLPSVFMSSHDFDTVVIMFSVFNFNKVPSKACGMTHKMSRIDAEPKQKLLTPVQEFSFFTGA